MCLGDYIIMRELRFNLEQNVILARKTNCHGDISPVK